MSSLEMEFFKINQDWLCIFCSVLFLCSSTTIFFRHDSSDESKSRASSKKLHPFKQQIQKKKKVKFINRTKFFFKKALAFDHV